MSAINRNEKPRNKWPGTKRSGGGYTDKSMAPKFKEKD